jgi:cell wall-associated NlpC family hydrolase
MPELQHLPPDEIRAALVAEAKTWIGSPVHWQGAVKGGTDCRGWIYATAKKVGMPEAANVEAALCNYPMNFTAKYFVDRISKILKRTDNPQPADLLAIKLSPKDKGPRHLAMLVDNNRIIHCYGRGLAKVVYVPLGKSRPIHSWWTWPSLQGE